MTAMALKYEEKAVVGGAAIDDGGLEMAGDRRGSRAYRPGPGDTG